MFRVIANVLLLLAVLYLCLFHISVNSGHAIEAAIASMAVISFFPPLSLFVAFVIKLVVNSFQAPKIISFKKVYTYTLMIPFLIMIPWNLFSVIGVFECLLLILIILSIVMLPLYLFREVLDFAERASQK